MGGCRKGGEIAPGGQQGMVGHPRSPGMQGLAQTLLQEQVGVSTDPQRGQGTHLLCWGWALVSVPSGALSLGTEAAGQQRAPGEEGVTRQSDHR